MIFFLTAFFASVLAVWLIIRSEHLHHHLTADSDLDGVQKFHVVAVPRVGGLGILIGMLASASWLSLLLAVPPYQTWLLLMVASPAFFGGITEDMTKRVGVLPRLLLTMLSAVAGYWFLGAALTRLDLRPGIFYSLKTAVRTTALVDSPARTARCAVCSALSTS